MSTILKRGQGTETVTWNRLTGVDKQGKPAYVAQGTTLVARVVREDRMVKMGNGSEVRTVATLWIDAAQPTPAQQDHVTLASGLVGVVVEVMQRKRLGGTIDHTRIRLREE